MSFDHIEAILLSWIPAILNFGLFAYVSIYLNRTRLSIYFSVILLSCFTWQFIEGLARATPLKENADYIYIGFVVAFHVFMIMCLFFILLFVERRKALSNPLISFWIPFIAVVFILLNSMNQIVPNLVYSDFWGWTVKPTDTFLDIIQVAWMSLLGFSFFVLLTINFYKKLKLGAPTNAAFLMLVAYAVPVIVGLVCQVFVPYIFNMEEVPLTSVAMTVFTVATFFAIKKYNILEFSKITILDNLVDTITDGIMIVDNENRIQYINKRSTEITGYNESDLIGKRAIDLLTYNESSQLKQGREIAEKQLSKLGSYDIDITTKSGEHIWLNIVRIPYYDSAGNVIGSIGLHKDITEQKEAEILLKTYDRTLRSLVQSTTEAIVVINNNNKVTLANTAAETLFQYSLEEMVGKEVSQILPDLNNDKVGVNKNIVTRNSNTKSAVIEERALTKLGKELIVELSLAPMNTDTGEHTSFVIRDVTLRIQYEAKLESINNELNTLIYKASHDLRGPVASIKGLVNLYDRPNNSVEDRLEYFKMIKTCTLQLDNILTELTEVNRITHEEISIVQFSLLAEIRKIVHQLRSLENHSKIKFAIDFKYQEFVKVDQKLLSIILYNTISNSILYTDLRKEQPEIHINVLDDDDGYVIEVIDNGLGMDRNVQDKAYNMFYRGISSSTGAGLGLYMARKAVMKIGGHIMLESNIGEGTKVRIFVPNHSKIDSSTVSLVS